MNERPKLYVFGRQVTEIELISITAAVLAEFSSADDTTFAGLQDLYGRLRLRALLLGDRSRNRFCLHDTTSR